jgi:hypothetical protein
MDMPTDTCARIADAPVKSIAKTKIDLTRLRII